MAPASMKILGTKQYKFGAGSPSDNLGLGFDTMEAAQAHADKMNVLREQYGKDSTWNTEYWKEKPEPWVAFERA